MLVFIQNSFLFTNHVKETTRGNNNNRNWPCSVRTSRKVREWFTSPEEDFLSLSWAELVATIAFWVDSTSWSILDIALSLKEANLRGPDWNDREKGGGRLRLRLREDEKEDDNGTEEILDKAVKNVRDKEDIVRPHRWEDWDGEGESNLLHSFYLSRTAYKQNGISSSGGKANWKGTPLLLPYSIHRSSPVQDSERFVFDVKSNRWSYLYFWKALKLDVKL